MPELVYNVKFQIDDGDFGQGAAGVSAYKEKVRELKEEIDRLKTSQDDFNESTENLDGAIGKTNKQVALGNQLFFSLSDGIQDSTQFAYGFGTGMRAVGNNIGFTTELAGAFIQRTREMNNGVLNLSGVMQGLRSSIMGVGGVVFAINTLVTLYTAFALRQEKAQRSTAKMNDEVRSLSQSLFSGLNFQAPETSREIEILTSILDKSTKSVENLSDAVIDQTQFQLDLTPAVGDATHAFSRYTQSAQDAQNKVDALKRAEEQAAKARKNAVLEVVRQRLAELEATQLIRDTMRELGVIGIADPFEFKLDIDSRRLTSEFSFVRDAITGELKKVEMPAEFIEMSFISDMGFDVANELNKSFNKRSETFQEESLTRRLSDVKRFNKEYIEITRDRLNAELELEQQKEQTRVSIFNSAQSAIASLSQVFANKNKGIAIALLAIEKGLKVAQVVTSATRSIAEVQSSASAAYARAAASAAGLGPLASVAAGVSAAGPILAQIPLIKATAGASVAAILAAGIGQGAQIVGGGGGGAGGRGGSTAGTSKFGFQMNKIEGAQTFRTPAFAPTNGDRRSTPKVDVRIMADRKQLYAIVKQGEEEYRQIKA